MRLRFLFLLNVTLGLIAFSPGGASAFFSAECTCTCTCLNDTCNAKLWYDDVDSGENWTAVGSCGTPTNACNQHIETDENCLIPE